MLKNIFLQNLIVQIVITSKHKPLGDVQCRRLQSTSLVFQSCSSHSPAHQCGSPSTPGAMHTIILKKTTSITHLDCTNAAEEFTLA